MPPRSEQHSGLVHAQALTGSERRAASRSRGRDIAEIATAYGLILLVIWTPRPAQRLLWWVAATAVIVMTCISFDGLRAMGLRRENFLRSLWIVGVALALALGAVLISGRLHALRRLGGPAWLLENYWAYAIWAAVQQFLLQCFFLLRLQRLIGSPKIAAVAAAGIFALAHVPSPILVTVTLIWGTAACLLFVRYRNLYPLAIAHAILGIALAIAIPGPVDHNMRVGLGYLTYNPHRHYGHAQRWSRSSQP